MRLSASDFRAVTTWSPGEEVQDRCGVCATKAPVSVDQCNVEGWKEARKSSMAWERYCPSCVSNITTATVGTGVITINPSTMGPFPTHTIGTIRTITGNTCNILGSTYGTDQETKEAIKAMEHKLEQVQEHIQEIRETLKAKKAIEIEANSKIWDDMKAELAELENETYYTAASSFADKKGNINPLAWWIHKDPKCKALTGIPSVNTISGDIVDLIPKCEICNKKAAQK